MTGWKRTERGEHHRGRFAVSAELSDAYCADAGDADCATGAGAELSDRHAAVADVERGESGEYSLLKP
jgi:hypothetical protein